jgi:hypothetical protein
MKKKFESENIILVNFKIDAELRKRYKIFCIENGYTLSDRIREFIESELKIKK